MAREMKDSGIEWIGEIPMGWNIQRGKNILSLLERPVLEDDGVITCFRDGEVTLRSKRREEGFTFSLQEVGYQGIEPGDLVVHGMDGFAGAIGISDSRGKATPVLNVMDSSQNKRYLMYYLRCAAYCGLFLSLATGIRVRSCDTNWNKLKVIIYLIPPIEEQERITKFLDKELLHINSVIEQTRASIEEYKKLKQAVITQAVTKGIRPDRPMKDSGVEWIGIIPESWHVAKLKYFASIRSGITLGKVYPSEIKLVEYPYLRVANVQGSYVDLTDVAMIKVTEEEAIKYRLKDGELLMTEGGDRDKLGRGTVWHAQIDPCLHQNHVFALRTNEKLLAEYVSNLSASFVGRDYFDVTANQSVHLASTNSTTIMNFTIPYPSTEEQKEIVDYLDDKTAKIDQMISGKMNLLSELDSYKKSLIYEYVTGKKEVPA